MNYEVKIKCNKTQENGKDKKVSEEYLVRNAELFGKAEEFIIKEMQSFYGDFSVSSIKKSKYVEIDLAHGGDRYFSCKVVFIILDEKTNKESNTSELMLVSADNIGNAKTYLEELMKDTLVDYKIDTIKETKLIDVYDVE